MPSPAHAQAHVPSHVPAAPVDSPHRRRGRLASVVVSAWAVATGIAPHVLHHAGPLAGAAFLAGTTGRIAFGLAGLALTAPMLMRVHRRHGDWRVPIALLAVFVAAWSLSTFVVGPRLYGERAANPALESPAPARQDAPGSGLDEHGHQRASTSGGR